MMKGKNVIEDQSYFDGRDTLVGQDAGFVLDDSDPLKDVRDSFDKDSNAFNRKEELRRQRREKEISELKSSKAYKFISTITILVLYHP